MLDRIPPELLEQIAVELVASPFLGPPRSLVPLFQVNRTVYLRVSNATVWASAFEEKFDTAAPRRRLGAMQCMTSTAVSAELKKRFRGMRRIRNMVAHLHRHIGPLPGAFPQSPPPNLTPSLAVGILHTVSENDLLQDLWMVYLMLLENDGKNFEQLRRWAFVHEWSWILFRGILVPAVSRPGWPTETQERTLAVWIIWLLSERASILNEPNSTMIEVLRAIRAYVFGAFEYPLSQAHFTHFHLPLTQYSTPPPPPFDRPQRITDPTTHLVHRRVPPELSIPLTPRLHQHIHATYINHYSHIMPLLPPSISHAAILATLVRAEKHTLVPPPNTPANAHSAPAGHTGPTLVDYRRLEQVSTPFPAKTDSTKYDEDWYRLKGCIDIFYSQPTLSSFAPGCLDGVWEGRFLHFDFNVYTHFLAGNQPGHQLLDNAVIGQNPQVWRIREYHCLRPSAPVVVGSPLDGHLPKPSDSSAPGGTIFKEIDNQTALEIYEEGMDMVRYERWVSDTTDDDSDEDSDRSEGEHDPLPDLGGPYIAGPPKRGRTMKSTGRSGGYPGRTSITASAYYGTLDESEDEEMMDDSDWRDDPQLGEWGQVRDIILMGETEQGHSAWGQVTLFGRVRPYDGMITIVKKHAGGRGSWTYTGHILCGENLVGRWRDSASPVDMNGYEGAFGMCRRK